MKPLIIYPDNDRNPHYLLSREWLCTNGLGGYASGTLLGVNTRRDHGLLVPYIAYMKSRMVVISHMTESVIESSPENFNLSGFEFVNGEISSNAHLYLKEFQLDHLIPTWIFSIGDSILEKRVLTPRGTNATLLQYRLLSGPNTLKITLKPFLTFVVHGNPMHRRKDFLSSFTELGGGFQAYYTDFDYPVNINIYGAQDLKFDRHEHWISNIYYKEDYERGNEPTDLLFNPGEFSFTLKEYPVTACLGMGSTENNELLLTGFDNHKARLQKKLEDFGQNNEFAQNICLATDQFIFNKIDTRVQDPTNNWSILAGFHWFLDWGRDSMISLEGLTLCTKQFDLAKDILNTLSHYIHNGLLFNCFNEGESTPSYNSADATLLFFHALNRYYQYTGDIKQVEDFYPLLISFINSYLNGIAEGIKVDPKDGLVYIYSENYPLTWMDAQIFGVIFTPRNGKPVEIQALWFNALKLLIEWSEVLGFPHKNWDELSLAVKRSFNEKFWYGKEYLFDVVDGPCGNDSSLRPNQILSIALDNPILEEQNWKQIIDVCQDQLLTGYGLRSLGLKDKAYHPHYKGNRFDRDSAYHQGAVWAWLIGYFIDAWLKVYNDRKRAYDFLVRFEEHLTEAGVGSISEVFDGSHPHIPRGCIAQAWSVAEVLRSIIKLQSEK